MATSKQSSSIYQVKVTLAGIRPPIWRRFQVRSHTKLNRLHEILQVVMGWDNYHLYQFIIGDEYFGQPDPDGFDDDMQNAKKIKLSEVYHGPKTKFAYEYDFGDSWEHEILIESELSAESGARYPRCLKGARACPPEDCGGIWGYADLLEIISDPDNEEYEEMMEWVGEKFDPEAFDLDDVNRALKSIK
jgi:hypothetical protein